MMRSSKQRGGHNVSRQELEDPYWRLVERKIPASGMMLLMLDRLVWYRPMYHHD